MSLEHTLEDDNVHILNREDRWFERVLKKAIYVQVEIASLYRGGGLRHYLSPIFHAALWFIPRKIKTNLHVLKEATPNDSPYSYLLYGGNILTTLHILTFFVIVTS